VSRGALTLLATLAAFFAALPGQAEAAVTATDIRIGNHPAFVRVVVDFTGGQIGLGNVFAADHQPFGDGRARVRVNKAGIMTNAAPEASQGVRAAIDQGANVIVLRLRTARERFKYLAYSVLHQPERLVVDLWKARPPGAGAVFTTASQGGCLTIDSFSVGPGTASAAGRERDLFEHMFQVRLRKVGGQVARTVGVTASAGHWSRSFGYSVAHAQLGTLEAVDFSEKDGSLVCIAQVRVTLQPPP